MEKNSQITHMAFVSGKHQPATSQYKDYTLDEVSKHCTPDSMWCIYDGNIYDITTYASTHPGGYDILKNLAGKDMTACYSYHITRVRPSMGQH